MSNYYIIIGIMLEYGIYIFISLVILFAYFWNENKWRFVQPTNDKKWRKNQQVLQTAIFHNDGTVTIKNLRDTVYRSFTDYTPRYLDVTVNPKNIVSAKIYTAKLSFPGVHMFTSFTFNDGHTISVSIKMRRYRDTYSLLHSLRLFLNPSELTYIILTEEDAITLNKKILQRQMHEYQIHLPQKELTALFVDVLKRANKLAKEPEFYSIFSNNCITNVLNHVNKNTHIQLPKMHWTYFATQHLGGLLEKIGLVEK